MELVLFYYTLLMLLVSIFVAAVCLSAYLVSRKKTMLFLSVAFAFYFFDISLVFQDEFIVRSCGDALTSGYLVVRSLASVVTGGGFVTAFWILLCDYLNETRRTVFVMPPAIFAIASVAMLVMIPDGDLQRFGFGPYASSTCIGFCCMRGIASCVSKMRPSVPACGGIELCMR